MRAVSSRLDSNGAMCWVGLEGVAPRSLVLQAPLPSGGERLSPMWLPQGQDTQPEGAMARGVMLSSRTGPSARL